MSRQIDDIYRYHQKKYAIIQFTSPLALDPLKYGINPESIITCCASGYWCEFTTVDDQLFLETLYIHAKNNYYPKIGGVCAKSGDALGHYCYQNVYIPIFYTGKILIAEGYVPGYTSPIGHRHVLGYQTILELTFDDGVLHMVSDQTNIAQSIRNQVEEHAQKLKHSYINNMRALYSIQEKMACDIWWL